MNSLEECNQDPISCHNDPTTTSAVDGTADIIVAPRVKQPRTVKQLEALAKARAARNKKSNERKASMSAVLYKPDTPQQLHPGGLSR